MRQMEHQTENSPRPSSVCALPCLMSFFIHTADCLCLSEIRDKFYVLDEEDIFETPCELLQVYKSNPLFNPRFGVEHVLSYSLVCADIGHCFLSLLMVIVLFTIRDKQDGTFSVADESPQIRLL